MPDWGAYAIRPYPDGPKKQDHFLNPYIFCVTLTTEKMNRGGAAVQKMWPLG